MKFDEVLKILYSNILDQYFELSMTIFSVRKKIQFMVKRNQKIFLESRRNLNSSYYLRI